MHHMKAKAKMHCMEGSLRAFDDGTVCLQELRGQRIVAIACGYAHTLAVTELGKEALTRWVHLSLSLSSPSA